MLVSQSVKDIPDLLWFITGGKSPMLLLFITKKNHSWVWVEGETSTTSFSNSYFRSLVSPSLSLTPTRADTQHKSYFVTWMSYKPSYLKASAAQKKIRPFTERRKRWCLPSSRCVLKMYTQSGWPNIFLILQILSIFTSRKPLFLKQSIPLSNMNTYFQHFIEKEYTKVQTLFDPITVLCSLPYFALLTSQISCSSARAKSTLKATLVPNAQMKLSHIVLFYVKCATLSANGQ